MHQATLKVLDRLRQDILSGAYPANTLMPSERKLVETFGIGRGAVLAVLRTLAEEDLLITESGRGYRTPAVVARPKIQILFLCSIFDSLFHATTANINLRGITDMAKQFHIELKPIYSEYCNLTHELLQKLQNREFSGVLFLERYHQPSVEQLLRLGIPVAVANCESSMEIPGSRMDYREVGRIAGYELLRGGHRKIGVITGNPTQIIFRELLAGLRGALAEEEVYLKPEWICPIEGNVWPLREEEQRLFENLLGHPNDRPDAIFTMRDVRARALYAECTARNLRIPDDISVISYDDNTWESADRVGLTTIREPAYELGGGAVKLLYDWITTSRRPEDWICHGELIRRHSVR